MTRKEEIESIAKNIATKFYYSDNPGLAYRAARQGEIQADKSMIEKACNWLKNNVNHFCYISAHSGEAKINEFMLVEEFEKAMEE